ncbi:MAG: hypothetical protein AAGH72_09365 [Verrucomicrobiota bacterium]
MSLRAGIADASTRHILAASGDVERRGCSQLSPGRLSVTRRACDVTGLCKYLFRRAAPPIVKTPSDCGMTAEANYGVAATLGGGE